VKPNGNVANPRVEDTEIFAAGMVFFNSIKNTAPKTLGDALRVPHLPFLNPTSSVSFSSLLPSSWLPLIYSPFPLFMDNATVFSCNCLNV
jgi:hypothetical protein